MTKQNTGQSSRPESPSAGYPIIVHSHLRWDWVWQRPQQFLSRLSRSHPVLFIEEPRANNRIRKPHPIIRPADNFPDITVFATELPEEILGNREHADAEHGRLVKTRLNGRLGKAFRSPVQWFYDPMAVTAFAGQLGERAIVYDCMDELSQFDGAPPELVRRERQLLALADVVFAGGPKIHQAKSQLHPNCHCYGCGVDTAHFGSAQAEQTQVPTDLDRLAKPILGYFGVVDERLDYQLIAALADSHPEWSVVFIGPSVKVDPNLLPQRRNLHWLGQRDYSQLPQYVKGFDVCLMPFALNAATEFINPTKALEYMSSATPIVSTAVNDVVTQFSDVLAIANSPAQFIEACEQAIAAPDQRRLHQALQLAQQNSWDSIIEKLETHIADILRQRDSAAFCLA